MKTTFAAFTLGLAVLASSTLLTSSAFAKHGADDPAGHVRGGHGADDPAGHIRGGHGADDPAGHIRGGHGADNPAGDDRGRGRGGKGRGGADDAPNHG